MQGSFPLEPRPYAAVAEKAGRHRGRGPGALSALLDDRIIRQVTPIYDTRAFGYGSMLVAAKVDPEHPWRPRRSSTPTPASRHNYLRNHEFNMWFTIAVEEDSALGLQGTLDVLQELTGAESIRQLPTLKLFKIRMDLEMRADTKALARRGEVVAPALEQAAVRRARPRRRPRHPGRPARRARAVRARRRGARVDRAAAARAHAG